MQSLLAAALNQNLHRQPGAEVRSEIPPEGVKPSLGCREGPQCHDGVPSPAPECADSGLGDHSDDRLVLDKDWQEDSSDGDLACRF